MTEQEKLLLQVLSEMYPYGVILHFDKKVEQEDEPLFSIRKNGITYLINDAYYLSEVKPYFRSMSSMTEKEIEELKQEHIKDGRLFAKCLKKAANGDNSMRGKVIPHFAADWCSKNHFDYIKDKEGKTMTELGLALEAPEGMYN